MFDPQNFSVIAFIFGFVVYWVAIIFLEKNTQSRLVLEFDLNKKISQRSYRTVASQKSFSIFDFGKENDFFLAWSLYNKPTYFGLYQIGPSILTGLIFTTLLLSVSEWLGFFESSFKLSFIIHSISGFSALFATVWLNFFQSKTDDYTKFPNDKDLEKVEIAKFKARSLRRHLLYLTLSIIVAVFVVLLPFFSVSNLTIDNIEDAKSCDLLFALFGDGPSSSNGEALCSQQTSFEAGEYSVSGSSQWLATLILVLLIAPFIALIISVLETGNRQSAAFNEDSEIASDILGRVKWFIIWPISVVFALLAAGIDLSGLGLASGLLAAGLSVAMRESITNFISGLVMAWDGSLKKGDVISIPQALSLDTGSTYGIVKDIRPRYTVVEDRNTVRRLIPNAALLNQTIEHWTHEDKSIRLSLMITIPFLEEPEKVAVAKKLMESVCYEVDRVLTDKTPVALLTSYSPGLQFSLRFWIRDAEKGIRPVISDVLLALYERFLANDIKIPFPKQDLYVKELPGLKYHIDLSNMTNRAGAILASSSQLKDGTSEEEKK